MEQIVTEARTEGAELGDIKRRIDGKGIVIFTLDSGGTIRDTDKDIFFSPHEAEHAATRYAEKKWGKRFILEKGHIRFQPGRESLEPELVKQRQQLAR